MTNLNDWQHKKRESLLIGAIFLCTMLVCGCASNTIDEAVPMATVAEPAPITPSSQVDSPRNEPSTASSVNHTGEYPNINTVPSGEIAQLSDVQTAATRAALEGEAQAQRRGGESAQIYAERLRKLQKLKSTHGDETLRQIEKSQP